MRKPDLKAIFCDPATFSPTTPGFNVKDMADEVMILGLPKEFPVGELFPRLYTAARNLDAGLPEIKYIMDHAEGLRFAFCGTFEIPFIQQAISGFVAAVSGKHDLPRTQYWTEYSLQNTPVG